MRTTNRTPKMLRHDRFALRSASLLTAFAVGAATLTCGAGTAHADDVSPKGKGIVGGALLGAEVVTIVESFAGVRNGWAYVGGAAGGAVAGGIGGYFVEQAAGTNGRVPVYMLAGGLALIIPAVVLTLNATRYMPDESASEDKGSPGADQPAADPGRPPSDGVSPATPPPGPIPPPASAPTPNPNPTPPAGAPAGTPQGRRSSPRTNAIAAAPPAPDALFQMNVDLAKSTAHPSLGVPVPSIRPMWSQREQKDLAVAQGTELRLPVVHVSF
jgi:pyruvate/2-oxoglutarate dehydrogenase complex dihydrolipoamide acyltransferase (E2) component